jgi:shikimate dehydrogenase
MAVLEIKGVRIGEGRTKTIVSLMDADREGLLATAKRAVAAGADCLEWRADFFGSLDSEVAVIATSRELMSALPDTPLIFTLRSKDQGGHIELAPERAMLLTCAVITARGADLVDVEIGLGDRLVGALAKLAHDNGVRTIVSHHDFAAMPSVDWMSAQLVHMAGLGADIPKLAAMSKSNQETHDLMRATSQAREQLDVPLLTMAMGASGTNSRLSGEVFGSALTFCALGRASAPGQVELSQALPVLEAIHRNLTAPDEPVATHDAAEEAPRPAEPTTPEAPKEISGHTHMICLLGNPTGHSLSPAMHNHSFARLGIDTRYLCFDVASDEQLPSVLGAMRAMEGWDGANVTMPFKQAVIPLLDEMDVAAELIGAVNVISKRDGRLCGHNTDGAGFMRNLRAHGVASEGARMVLFGCGGAGSAVLVQAALDGAERIDVFCRPGRSSWQNAERLQARLAERCSCQVNCRDLGDPAQLKACIDQATVLVNSTSVGMGEQSTDTLVDPALLHEGLAVADVIYLPRITQLLRDAVGAGCKIVGGLGMILEQAAESETIWYGVEMDTRSVEQEVLSAQ